MLNIYETVYGLVADPFRLSPDYRFSYSHPSYARSKAYMDYALLQGEGFVMITGAPGTGKTTLVREVLANIDIAHVQVATLTSTQLRTRDLLQMVATAFGLHFKDSDKATLLTALEQSLLQQHKSGRRAVLIVDEAQGLSIDALEELRLLANLQSDNQMLMQVFLLGQEKLRELINSPTMEQLRQRVVASSLLEQLDLDETVNYVEHRLNQAGWQGDPEFSGEALQLIHKSSGGLPRRINLICTRLLLSGGLKDKHVFVGQDVRDVILELQKEMLIDTNKANLKINDSVNVRSLGPFTGDVPDDEVNPDTAKQGQWSESSDSDEGVADAGPIPHPSSRKHSGGLSPGKVFSHRSRPDKKKTSKKHEQTLSAPAEYEKAAAVDGDAAKPEGERAHILPFNEGKDGNSGSSVHDVSITKRSIALATARSAPVSRGWNTEDRMTVRRPDFGSNRNYSATGAGSDEREDAVKTSKRNTRPLKIQFFVIMLVVGSLTAVAGIKYRDYTVAISVQADNNGVIRGIMPAIEYSGTEFDGLVSKRISKEPGRGGGVSD
jgi:putative secretion ATPase (PEP-CTERM system associated)